MRGAHSIRDVLGQVGRAIAIVAGVCAVCSESPPAVAGADAAGPIAAYGFDENAGTQAADSSGNGLTATLVGAVWTPAGKFGSALTFDGVSSRVTLIHDAPLLRLTTAMTLEAWVKPATTVNSWEDIVYKGNDNYFLCASSQPSGVAAAGGTFGGTNTVVLDVAPLPANVWSYLAATYDGAQLRLYVNGTLASSRARTGTLLTSHFALQIGGDSFYGQSFAGAIDELRVYNRALTLSEIQVDMNARVVAPVADSAPPSTPTALTAVPFTGTEIQLTWPASTDNVAVTGYRVERCRGAGCQSFVQIATASGPFYDDTGLARNTSYTYRVRAADAGGNTSLSGPTASATTLSTSTIPGLVAAYAFDEGAGGTASDASGTGNTGVLANAAWTGAGRFGSALLFNGTNSWVTVADAPSLHLTTGMTLEAWVNPVSIPPLNCSGTDCHWVDILFKQTDAYYLEGSSDVGRQPEVGGVFTTGKHVLFAPAPLALGMWTHLALTYNGAILGLYVNGDLVASADESAALTQTTQPLRIGGDSDFVQFFNGTIDEVRVYSRGLSAYEVRGDVNTPVGTASANPMPLASSLIPSTAAPGGPAFTLTVLGSGFVPGSIVGWNGADRATTFIDTATLRAEIEASDIAAAGTAQVTVFNPPFLGGTSGALPVIVCAPLLWYRDVDGDGYGDPTQSSSSCAQPLGYVSAGGDCDDADATVWSVPGEARSLEFVDSASLAWTAPALPGGTSLHYDTLRADAPDGFGLPGSCLETDGADTSSADPSLPGTDAAYFYLVRARDACGVGTTGALSSGGDRTARACP